MISTRTVTGLIGILTMFSTVSCVAQTISCCTGQIAGELQATRLVQAAGTDEHDKAGQEPVNPHGINVPKHLSPEMRKIMLGWTPYWEVEGFKLPAPDDFEGWRRQSKAQGDMATKIGRGVLREFGVDVKERQIRGVRVLDVKPKGWEEHKDKVIIHTHGGGFYANTPESSASSYVPLSAMLKVRVISVDYTLMPEKNWSVLKQRGQVIDVYKSLIEDEGFKPRNVGAFGCSAGGYLALSFCRDLSKENYPLPAAIVAIAPFVDFTLDSDTFTTLGKVDPQMNPHLFGTITMKMLGITKEMARTPEYSIIRDDFSGLHFPPTLLQVGTKEALLSDSVRMYSVLRQAGIEVEIDPHDAMMHCFHTI